MLKEHVNELQIFITKTLDEAEKLQCKLIKESLKVELSNVLKKVDYILLDKGCKKCSGMGELNGKRCKYCSGKGYRSFRNE